MSSHHPSRLAAKLRNHAAPLTFFEMVPPPMGKPEGAQALLAEALQVKNLVEAINLPEIHDEGRPQTRTAKFVPRESPRVLARYLQKELDLPVVVNRCTVRDPNLLEWIRHTVSDYGVHDLVFVGGDSSLVSYPGPSVGRAAAMVREARYPVTLGGICIPSRRHEADRMRAKGAAGIDFFTTQVLYDPNDIVWLIQQLNGFESRIFLSFAPVSHPRDLQFLRWLGADIPADLDAYLLEGGHGPAGIGPQESGEGNAFFRRSLDLCQRILIEVFDNLPPEPPPIGLNIEHINKRNFGSAVLMLNRLAELYRMKVAAHVHRR
jgi:5,10-methylenetetrahydrofolate reductase